MRLEQVTTFLALAEELHFGRTATRLHLPQSRVSRLVAALEREVGGPLFERNSRLVALTELGEGLLAELAPAYAALELALHNAQHAARGTTGTLRIGFTITSDGYRLNRLVRQFDTRHPECEVSLREVPTQQPFDRLRAGDVDVLAHWVLDPMPGFTCAPVLGSHPRVLAVAADSPLAAASSVSAEVLGDWPVPDFLGIDDRIRQLIIPDRTPAGRAVHRHPTPVTTISEAVSLVARGAAVQPTVAALAQITYGRGIALVPLTDLPPLRLGLYWPAAADNPAIRTLVDFAAGLA